MAIEPGEVHVTRRLRVDGRGADYDVVRVDAALVEEAARELGVAGPFHLKSPALDDPALFSQLTTFVGEVAQGGCRLAVEGAFHQAIGIAVCRFGETRTRSGARLDPLRDYRLRKLDEYLHDEADTRASLDELARLVRLSKWRLCVIFAEAFGVSIGEYRTLLRLGKAARRLIRGDAIKVIVAEHGWSEAPYFNRVFKKHIGVSPGAFRSLYRKNDRLSKSSEQPPVRE